MVENKRMTLTEQNRTCAMAQLPPQPAALVGSLTSEETKEDEKPWFVTGYDNDYQWAVNQFTLQDSKDAFLEIMDDLYTKDMDGRAEAQDITVNEQSITRWMSSSFLRCATG